MQVYVDRPGGAAGVGAWVRVSALACEVWLLVNHVIYTYTYVYKYTYTHTVLYITIHSHMYISYMHQYFTVDVLCIYTYNVCLHAPICHFSACQGRPCSCNSITAAVLTQEL